MDNRIGMIQLSLRVLTELLYIPEGQIQAVELDMENQTLVLQVQHPEMPPVDEGTPIPEYQICVTTFECGHSCDKGRCQSITRVPFIEELEREKVDCPLPA